MVGTLRLEPVYTKLQKIAQQAVDYPERIFTTLAHLIDVEFLKEAFSKLRKNAVPGISGTTAIDYVGNLEANLTDLHERLKNGKYRATPVKRVWLDKDDGSKRPIGICDFEDKIVQQAVTMLLTAIYEQDFYDFSFGFRPSRSPHQALTQLRDSCMELNINWIIDADVSGFFDNISRKHLREIIKLRVNDGSILRLIGKWLNAGIIDGNELTIPDKGTIQGGNISPILSNIYLHVVLDKWFIKEIKPHLKGQSFLVRFADDFIIGCELEDEAKWLMQELAKRLHQFGLSIHPEKSKLVRFGKPKSNQEPKKYSETLDFLGFTHYWSKSRRGFWVIKRKTARKRLRRTLTRIWRWCQKHCHDPIKLQYQKISAKLRGHYQYYGIRCNLQALKEVHYTAVRAWRFWLSRRGGKTVNWQKI